MFTRCLSRNISRSSSAVTLAGLLAAMSVYAAPRAAHASILFSDDFNSDPINTPYGFREAIYDSGIPSYAGSIPVSDGTAGSYESKWNVFNGRVNLVDHTYANFHQAGGTDPDPTDAHQHFVDLNGVPVPLNDANGIYTGPGEIRNADPITLPVGEYQLSFQLAGSHQLGGSSNPGLDDYFGNPYNHADTAVIMVYAVDSLGHDHVFYPDGEKTVLNITLNDNVPWTDFTYDFTNDDGVTYDQVYVSFQDGSTTQDPTIGLLLDNVSLSSIPPVNPPVTGSPVPEPASLGMLAVGGLTLLGRRRRNAPKTIAHALGSITAATVARSNAQVCAAVCMCMEDSKNA